MDDLPEPKHPEYLTWPLEKLQQEYWKLKLQHTGLKLKQIEANQAIEEAEDLARAFKRFLDRVEE